MKFLIGSQNELQLGDSLFIGKREITIVRKSSRKEFMETYDAKPDPDYVFFYEVETP